MQRLTAYVSGMVQQAGYRARAVTIARAFGLIGYVQNLPDGRVMVIAEGEEADLDRFEKALWVKNTIIKVANIRSEYSPATGEFVGFGKIVDEGETDQRMDKAVDYLKELIVVVKEGVAVSKENLAVSIENLAISKENLAVSKEILSTTQENLEISNENLAVSKEGFQGIGDKLDEARKEIVGEIRASKDEVVNELRETREEIISEVRELRSDFRERVEDRLRRIESDISQIKAKTGL
jgi:acylphosphatase/gas vesicle protein